VEHLPGNGWMKREATNTYMMRVTGIEECVSGAR
jgi:hypothetical protein